MTQNLVRSDDDLIALRRISALAAEVADLAAPLDKPQHRNGIYNAAKLIQWLVCDVEDYGDPETQAAIKALIKALDEVKPTGLTKIYAD